MSALGKGKLFRGFLKVDNRCSVCGLDFTPQRADDLPAYLVIVIVGHIVVPTATTLAATSCWLMPRQALAKARNIVDLIRDDAAKAQDS